MPKIPASAFIALALLGCGGCGCQGEPSKPPAKPGESAPDPHPETQKLRAADAVGYDGELLKQSVDKMLDQREKQKKDLEDAQKSKPAGQE